MLLKEGFALESLTVGFVGMTLRLAVQLLNFALLLLLVLTH